MLLFAGPLASSSLEGNGFFYSDGSKSFSSRSPDFQLHLQSTNSLAGFGKSIIQDMLNFGEKVSSNETLKRILLILF